MYGVERRLWPSYSGFINLYIFLFFVNNQQAILGEIVQNIQLFNNLFYQRFQQKVIIATVV